MGNLKRSDNTGSKLHFIILIWGKLRSIEWAAFGTKRNKIHQRAILIYEFATVTTSKFVIAEVKKKKKTILEKEKQLYLELSMDYQWP